MKRGDIVQFKLKLKNGDWSEVFKGVLRLDITHDLLHLYVGCIKHRHFYLNLDHLYSGYVKTRATGDPFQFNVMSEDQMVSFAANVPFGYQFGWQIHFEREPREAALTFLLCCRSGNVPLHKDIAHHIAKMIYHSGWDQIWRKVKWKGATA